MNGWLEQLDKVVTEAGDAAALPGPVVRGFDGDGWAWAWREYRDGQQAPTVVVEAQFRARPDSLNESINTEVLSKAWKPEQRELSWARTYPTPYLELQTFDSSDTAALSRFVDRLASVLSTAWKGALSAASGLDDISTRRDRLTRKLRAQGILGG